MSKKYHTIIPASYLFLRKDDKILLLRRYNTGFEDGKYSMIAGHIEYGESAASCCIREAYEEAGIIVNKKDLRFVHVLHRVSGDQTRVDFFFEATVWQGEIYNKEPNKCDDLSWFSLSAVPENTIPFIKRVCDSYLLGIFYNDEGF